jgi:hypothetical protein
MEAERLFMLDVRSRMDAATVGIMLALRLLPGLRARDVEAHESDWTAAFIRALGLPKEQSRTKCLQAALHPDSCTLHSAPLLPSSHRPQSVKLPPIPCPHLLLSQLFVTLIPLLPPLPCSRLASRSACWRRCRR